MKNNRLENLKGLAGVFVLVMMLILAAALPIGVKLVQQRQENRSKATSETTATQAKKCQNIGGICQIKTSACAGTYIPNLCSGTNVSCCSSVRDTDECLNMGGRCSKKTATGSGTFVHGTNDLNLCSSKNGSDIDCWVATGSATPCTAMGGTCATSSAKTSGGNCNSDTGFFDLTYSCKSTDNVCCIPSGYDFNGVCAQYNGLVSTAIPEALCTSGVAVSEGGDNVGIDGTLNRKCMAFYDALNGLVLTAIPEALCTSGIAVWDGGDAVGTDGTINWKCKGFNDALTVDCSAKFSTVKDTQKCLNVGGRCRDRNKEATVSGFRSDSPDLCSESNASNVGCWVATGSVNPCTAMGGKCFGSTSVVTSGGVCAVSDQISGNYNLNYSCNASTSACCVPTTVTYNGKCKDYSKVISTTIPTSLCLSGVASWEGGDNVGNDGVFNWKCTGLNGGTEAKCTAKIKKNGVCNTEYTDVNKSFTSRPSDAVVCSSGTLSSKAISGTYFTWKCTGLNGGVTASCKAKYDSCGASGGMCLANKTQCTSLGGRQGSDSVKSCGSNFCCVLSGAGTVLSTGITLSPTFLPLHVGESGSMAVIFVPRNTTNKTVTWSSSNPGVATIDSNGLVKAISVGSAFITAKTSNRKIAKATVAVVAIGVPIPTGTLTPTPKITNTPTPTGTLTPTPTGTLTPTPTGDGSIKVSFKFAFRGISPGVSKCFEKLGNLKIGVMSLPSMAYQMDVAADFTALVGETTSDGDQIFQVNNLAFDSTKFSKTVTTNYLKIKGPFHLQARMCQNNQSKYLGDTVECNIGLASGTVYDFTKYSLKPGDVDHNGAINGIDFGLIKTAVGLDADPVCGRDYDLNFDGVVNSVDTGLIKTTLSSRDGE